MEKDFHVRLPLGTSDFEALRDFGQIYVDKTELIFKLASQRRRILFTRPRRFGKSLLVSTLKSLFGNGLRDFSGLAIERLWNESRTYKVVHLDFSAIKNFQSAEEFHLLLPQVLDSAFSCAGFRFDSTGRKPFYLQFSEWLQQQKVNSIVLLIDEYDAPLTECLGDKELFCRVSRELSDFYTQLKRNDGAFRFLFITGIARFGEAGVFSGLNNLTDITADPRFGSLLGFTAEEVRKYFAPFLADACNELQMTESELLEKLTENYGGYCFDYMAKSSVMSPWSLLRFLDNPDMGFRNYWFESGGGSAVLRKFLRPDSLGDSRSFAQSHSVTFRELSDAFDSDVSLLTQAGYLTIKAADDFTAAVNYPNEEVKRSMEQLYEAQLKRLK